MSAEGILYKEDVKKKLLPALHGQMHVVACIQPRWNAGGVLRAVGRAIQCVVLGRWFHDEMVVDLGSETTQAEVLAKVPTMILFETRGLQLFWVVRGGIRSNGRLSAEASAHHGLIPS